MFVYKNDNFTVPVKVWMDLKSYESDPEVIKQVENLATLPFVYKQVVLTPDGHIGHGMPIGAVIATKGVVLPNAVGVDIGCGMLAVKTSLHSITADDMKKIMKEIRREIPVGFERRKKPVDDKYLPQMDENSRYPVIGREYKSAACQLGTLGGGNHFIELQIGSDSNIWYMIHSGSRNLGKKTADYHNNKAIDMNNKSGSSVFKQWQLASFPTDSEQGMNYLAEMEYCLKFAHANRQYMSMLISEIMSDVTDAKMLDEVNIHHNYAALEVHFGESVMVHRKGSTRAYPDETGIIPGSQGAKSYIVKGKGNPESFCSCSHGAGRKMGRKEAVNSLDFSEEVAGLTKQGIIHSIRNKNDLEEAPGAYKDIDWVMQQQSDLVDIAVELSPLAVIKG